MQRILTSVPAGLDTDSSMLPLQSSVRTQRNSAILALPIRVKKSLILTRRISKFPSWMGELNLMYICNVVYRILVTVRIGAQSRISVRGVFCCLSLGDVEFFSWYLVVAINPTQCLQKKKGKTLDAKQQKRNNLNSNTLGTVCQS